MIRAAASRARPARQVPALALALALLASGARASAALAPADAEFVNASRPTRCAEEDNVDVRVLGRGIAAFDIVAQHPPYIASLREDSTAPDFSACDMSADPRFEFPPRDVVLYEDARMRVVGHAFASFWRPDVVEFRVGERRERGLHLVQLLARRPGRDVEILVVYPSDGYWRAKPLPPPALADTAYGSSFLVGPVTDGTRPYVALRRIDFDPATRAFRLRFRDGGRATLTVTESSPERTRLAVSLDPPVRPGRAFAALRSMFVAPAQADVARADWPARDAPAHSAPILGFERFTAASARFGRDEPSRHNTSAPDLVFESFARARRR